MYSTHFLPLTIRHFKFCRFIRNLAFEYDSKYGKFFLIKSKTPVIKAKVAYVLSLIYVCVLLYRIANFPMLRMLQGFPILFCYVLLLSIGPNVGLDIAPVQIINSILTFEKDLLQGITDSIIVSIIFVLSTR